MVIFGEFVVHAKKRSFTLKKGLSLSIHADSRSIHAPPGPRFFWFVSVCCNTRFHNNHGFPGVCINKVPDSSSNHQQYIRTSECLDIFLWTLALKAVIILNLIKRIVHHSKSQWEFFLFRNSSNLYIYIGSIYRIISLYIISRYIIYNWTPMEYMDKAYRSNPPVNSGTKRLAFTSASKKALISPSAAWRHMYGAWCRSFPQKIPKVLIGFGCFNGEQ